MTDALVLAIDIGTSAVRSAAVDGGGVIVASTRVTRPDASAGTRFDAERLWLDVVQSIVSLPASARARISTLAIAGHVGTVFVDADGAPVGEGRGWADSSGIELLTAAAGDSLAELLAAAGRTTPAGGAGSALLALRRSDPAAAASVACVLTPKDFVNWRFTRAAVTDRTSAAYSGLSAIADSTWSPRMLELVGLDPAQLPEQFAADEIVGELASEVADELGLNRGVAVAAGATDGSVGAALVLRDRQGEAMCFVASGAVKVHLPDRTYVELGSGEFFGELALLAGEKFAPKVTSLGYSRLLMLSARDFRALLARDQALRERVEQVARQRMRALEVWRNMQDQQPAPDSLAAQAQQGPPQASGQGA